MNFSDKVLLIGMAAPEGWKQKVTLKQYAKLGDRQKYYEPLYAKYRTKKIRDYDPDYGNFIGWRPIQVGIGDATTYKYVGYWVARTIDQLNSSNVLTERIFNKKKWSK